MKDNPDQESKLNDDPDIKVILLGDSAVGKSKLVERFLEDEYQPRRVSQCTFEKSVLSLIEIYLIYASFTSIYLALYSCLDIIPQELQTW